jgi:hypothetical protein
VGIGPSSEFGVAHPIINSNDGTTNENGENRLIVFWGVNDWSDGHEKDAGGSSVLLYFLST